MPEVRLGVIHSIWLAENY